MAYIIGNLDLGVTFKGDVGDLEGKLNQASASVDGFARNARSGVNDVGQASASLESSFSNMANSMRGALIGGSVTAAFFMIKAAAVDAISALVDAQVQLDKMNNAFRFAVGAEQSVKEIAFMRSEVNRLGLDLGVTAQNFSRLSAASKDTSMQGRQSREIFSGLSEAFVVLGLNAEQTDRAFNAVTQMMSKGKVQAEELRGQLGEHVPGAFSIAAKSMGVTTSELSKMLETGQVLSEDFLPKFAAQLRGDVADSLDQATHSMQASLNRLSSSWLDLKQQIVQSGIGDELSRQVNMLAQDLGFLGETLQKSKANGENGFVTFANVSGAAIGRLTFAILNDLIPAVDVMPLNLMSAAEKAVYFTGELNKSEGQLSQLKESLSKSGGSPFIQSQIDQVEVYIKKMKDAQGEIDKLKVGDPRDKESGASRGSQAVYLKQVSDAEAAAAQERGRLAGVTKDYLPTLSKYSEWLKLGVIQEAEYVDMVSQLAKANYKKSDSMKESEKDAKSHLSQYKSLSNEILNYSTKLTEQHMAESTLTEGQKLAIKVHAELSQKIKGVTDAERASTEQKLQAVLSQEQDNIFLKEKNKLLAEHEKYSDGIAKEIEKQIEYNANIGLSKQQLAELAAVKLDDAAASKDRQAAIAGDIDFSGAMSAMYSAEAKSLRELAALKRSGGVQEASFDAAKKAKDEWERTGQSINQSITDGLMRGFEAGKGFAQNLIDTIKNMFSTLVLRPVVQWAVGGLTGLGGSSAMANSVFGGASGTGSMFGNLASMFDKLGANVSGGMIKAGDYLATSSNDYAAKLGELMQSSSSLAGSFAKYGAAAAAGVGIGNMVSGQYSIGGSKNTATMLGTGIGALMGGPWGAVLGGAVGGLANRAFGMGSKDVTSSGLVGSLSTDSSSLQNYTNWHQDGGWFRSDRSGTDYSAANGDLMSALQAQINDTHKAIDMWSGVLGGSFRSLTNSININLAGLDEAARTAKVTEAINSFTDQMVSGSLSIVSEFQNSGETLTNTLMRVGQSVKTASDTFALMGVDVWSNTQQKWMLDAKNVISRSVENKNYKSDSIQQSTARVDMQVVDKFGGLDSFSQSTSNFFGSFYKESEQTSRKTELLAGKIAELGFAMPSTREEFRKLAEAQDLSSSSGQTTYAALLQLAPAFADVVPWINSTSTAADTLSKSLADIANAFTDAIKSLGDEKLSLEQQLLQAQGNSAGAAQSVRDNYLSKTTMGMSTDQADQVAAAYDYNRALENQIKVTQVQIGLDTQLLQLQGNTAALREHELAVLDPSNRALQESIYALQDKQAADSAQVQMQQQQASAAQQLAEAWKSLGATMQSEVDRIRVLVSGGSTALAAMQADFAVNTAAARAGDQTAAGKLAGLSQSMLESALGSVSTREELTRLQAATAASLEETMRMLGGRGVATPTVPGFATGGDFAGGLRIVGEHGPELEATGASRIFNASQTASMLGGGSGMVDELRALRAEVASLRAEVQGARADNTAENRALVEKTSKVASILDDVSQGGTRIRTVESAA